MNETTYKAVLGIMRNFKPIYESLTLKEKRQLNKEIKALKKKFRQ